LQRARVVEPDHIFTEAIGFGTAFQIKNMDTGEIEEYTLLGLWDAEPEKNILSYITPFGRQFLKCKVGHSLVVVRPGGGSTQYKVLSIRNALV
jgi:transcription elongation GreA/GreB family factor